MTSGEVYRAKADTMAARARADTTQAGREHYALLCLGYLRLAEQVDRRSQIDSVHETLSSDRYVELCGILGDELDQAAW